MPAKHGCWTCKKRKIGCDRALPACYNCIRTRRHCYGYGMRLVWPPDGRANPGLSTPANSTRDCQKHAAVYFLNYTTADFVAAETKNYEYLLRPTALTRPTAGLCLRIAIAQAEEPLLSYYTEVISPMCSTTQIRNGFQTDILPLVLGGQDASSTALCKAMLAIAAHHRNDFKAALSYKYQAISQLFLTFRRRQTSAFADPVDCELAAALMLCMYSVFDQHEGNWHIHLAGAQSIIDSGPCRSKFLLQWAHYYSVLGAFTQPSHRRSTAVLATPTPPKIEPHEPIIIGALGCSIEVFHLIHKINVLRQGSYDPKVSHRSHAAEVVKHRLDNLSQILDFQEEQNATPQRRKHILATAELYRIAALLYALRIHPTDELEFQRTVHVEAACKILATLDVASCPWPVFVVACESQTEEQRAMLIEAMDRMGILRGVGNLFVMRDIVGGFWKQNDLRAPGSVSDGIAWWDFGDNNVAVPWFV